MSALGTLLQLPSFIDGANRVFCFFFRILVTKALHLYQESEIMKAFFFCMLPSDCDDDTTVALSGYITNVPPSPWLK